MINNDNRSKGNTNLFLIDSMNARRKPAWPRMFNSVILFFFVMIFILYVWFLSSSSMLFFFCVYSDFFTVFIIFILTGFWKWVWMSRRPKRDWNTWMKEYFVSCIPLYVRTYTNTYVCMYVCIGYEQPGRFLTVWNIFILRRCVQS